jgi:hypothetical protein
VLGLTTRRWDAFLNSIDVSTGIISTNVAISTQSDTYTLVAADSGKVVAFTNASAKVITIPAGLPIGFRTQITRLGAGTLTLSNTGQTGATIFSRTGSFAITAQYASASVFQPSANVYIIDGSI